ncbi:O-antigen ligase family protein [Micromonospora sp. NPDC049102]|uniref:O-antigen ligase family protein n=1 Tax=Micromonospora sp. NPDC049102 TaxID=3364265 RepID=UPI0037197319
MVRTMGAQLGYRRDHQLPAVNLWGGLGLVLVCVLAAVAPVAPATVQGRYVLIALLLIVPSAWRCLGWPDLLAVVLAVWASAAAISVTGVPSSANALWAYWGMCTLFVAARGAVTNASHFALVGCAYLGGCVWAAVEVVSSARGVDPTIDPALIRVGIGAVNPNYTAYSLVTGVVVAVAVARAGGLSRRLRLAVLAAIPLLAYAVVWNGTRGALMALVLVAGYLLAARAAPRVAWTSIAVAAPALLIAIPFGVYGDSRLLWLQEFFARRDDNMSGRLYLWALARQVWEGHIWTGIGPGMFPTVTGIGAHSVPLTIAVELGAVGLALFAALGVAVLVGPAGSGTVGKCLAGVLVLAWLPILLSGHWELSPAGWLVAALWSRMSPGTWRWAAKGTSILPRSGTMAGRHRADEDVPPVISSPTSIFPVRAGSS